MNLAIVIKVIGQLKALPPGHFRLGAFSEGDEGWTEAKVQFSPQARIHLEAMLKGLGVEEALLPSPTKADAPREA